MTREEAEARLIALKEEHEMNQLIDNMYASSGRWDVMQRKINAVADDLDAMGDAE